MTYRASLGTRGELRRIAAEAENVTIDRVRPWIRKIQRCRLAPHVIVPQWTRLEHPVQPKPPPPLVSQSRIVSGELIEEILESATAKKFRRGRGRRGRPRKRPEGTLNPDLVPAENGDRVPEAVVVDTGSAARALETVTGNAEDAQKIGEPNTIQKSERDAERSGGPAAMDGEETKPDHNQEINAERAQMEANGGSKVGVPPTAEKQPEKSDLNSPVANDPVPGEDTRIEAGPLSSEKATEEENINKDVEMTEVFPESKESST